MVFASLIFITSDVLVLFGVFLTEGVLRGTVSVGEEIWSQRHHLQFHFIQLDSLIFYCTARDRRMLCDGSCLEPPVRALFRF